MIDPTVSNFFVKNADEGYLEEYDKSHGPRLDAMIERFNLGSLRDQKIADVGGGLGFLGKRLHPDNDYWVIDGATVMPHHRLCKGHWPTVDLDRDYFGTEPVTEQTSWVGDAGSGGFLTTPLPQFDVAFYLETIEHQISPYHCVDQIKSIVKPNGLIYISTPTETVWHNTPFPSLFWPPGNFIQWLGQMALPVMVTWKYEPRSVGWPAYHYVCRNADWVEADMLYKKSEAKFRGKKPHEYANL